ncbi:hypothetical protein EVAR_70769_1 [Eumeta japonica]|uniref:Uncharacterized protein n=1 Tax=Eumeta variegata TaxID=151549 RepID=A0A4C1ZZE9_EUMVA|nr:hypothetical protein EVAR_70769_1 [Eumeta japonica]
MKGMEGIAPFLTHPISPHPCPYIFTRTYIGYKKKTNNNTRMVESYLGAVVVNEGVVSGRRSNGDAGIACRCTLKMRSCCTGEK